MERQQADPASTLALYRAALRLRRALPALGDGTLSWVDTGEDVLAFRRDPGFLCVVNTGETAVQLPAELRDGYEAVLSSGPPAADGTVGPDTATWYTAR